MRGNYSRPSEILRRQKETGKSYWDLIDRPLYDEPEDDQISMDVLNQQINQALERYNRGKNFPSFGGGLDRYRTAEDFITQYEGFEPEVYQKNGDVPTIGYGTTDPKWIKKGRITKQQGRQAMQEYLTAARPVIRKYIKNYDRLPDSAKIVVDDIFYNIGEGNLRKSPKFLNAINSGNWNEAVRQMDWDNNKPGFGGAKIRNAARGQLFMRDINNMPSQSTNNNWSGMRSIPTQTVERPIQTGVVYRSPAQSDPIYTNTSTGSRAATPAKLDRYYAEKEARQTYANQMADASKRMYASPLDMWNSVVGYSRGKSYPFNFWNRNGNALKPVIRYGRGKD